MRLLLVTALALANPAGAVDRLPPHAVFNAVDGMADALTIAVGDHGSIVHYTDETGPRRIDSPTERDLLDVHVGSAEFALAVGNGIVMHWNGDAWKPIVLEDEGTPYSTVWASPDRKLFLYGSDRETRSRLCPLIPDAVLQPFCRWFDSNLRAICGTAETVYIVLASGAVHEVNDALIGKDGGYDPVHLPSQFMDLRDAWMPGRDCRPERGLPEVFGIEANGTLVRFDGVAWRELNRLSLVNRFDRFMN